MSSGGLGGLNKSPNGVVIGVVQLQLPVVATPEQLAAQTETLQNNEATIAKLQKTIESLKSDVAALRYAYDNGNPLPPPKDLRLNIVSFETAAHGGWSRPQPWTTRRVESWGSALKEKLRAVLPS